jgi:hypothetical protein
LLCGCRKKPRVSAPTHILQSLDKIECMQLVARGSARPPAGRTPVSFLGTAAAASAARTTRESERLGCSFGDIEVTCRVSNIMQQEQRAAAAADGGKGKRAWVCSRAHTHTYTSQCECTWGHRRDMQTDRYCRPYAAGPALNGKTREEALPAPQTAVASLLFRRRIFRSQHF